MLGPGSVIAKRYRVERKLGAGGMGSTWAGFDDGLKRTIAIKFLERDFASDHNVLVRFQREAAAAARIHDSHVVAIYDVGIDDERPYIVMELVPGRNLAEVIRAEGRLTASRAVGLVVPACRALASVHEAKIIHRDLKPSNFMVTPDPDRGERLVLLDFGIARIRDAAANLAVTGSGGVFGTPIYMAPEQLAGRSEVIDERTDIYQLGVTLFEMIAGSRAGRGRHCPAALASTPSDCRN